MCGCIQKRDGVIKMERNRKERGVFSCSVACPEQVCFVPMPYALPRKQALLILLRGRQAMTYDLCD